MKIVEANNLHENYKTQVFNLWNKEYPENLVYKTIEDFDHYLANLTAQHHVLLINDLNHTIQGWYFDFYREHEQWFIMILDATIQGQGYGAKLLQHAKAKEAELNGWVIDQNNYYKNNGNLYKSPLNFYLKNGFKTLPDTRLELETISAVKIKWIKP